jgi:hypothetical protein
MGMNNVNEQVGVILRDVFTGMMESKRVLFHKNEDELAAREALKKVEASIINSQSDPKTLGSNDKARDAKIRELTFSERSDLERLEREKREAQLEYDLDCMRVDCLKWEIRAEMGATEE